MTPVLHADLPSSARLAAHRMMVHAGEKVAVIGPNGSGKTSLLRALAGVDQGKPTPLITVGGEALLEASPARRRRLLSFLPASREISWPIPVRDVVALGLDKPDPGRVTNLLELLSLEGLAERAIDSLSTGERARALLARAMAPSPLLLLLDEPLSNLDPAWALRLLNLFEQEGRRGAALVVTLHDLSLLPRFDRVLMMESGAVALDAAPAEVLASPLFSAIFEIEPAGRGWQLRQAGPRSSR